RSGGSQFSPQGGTQRGALQPGDRWRRIELLGTAQGAGLMTVTGMAPGIACDGAQALVIAVIAHVVDQAPGAVERGRAEILGIPRHYVAGGVADAAADAFDGGIRRLALARLRRNQGKIGSALCRWLVLSLGPRPFVEELRHIDRSEERRVGKES